MPRKKHEINPECGKRLKQWLEFSGISAQTLCKAINYTPQYMSDIVTGKKRLTPELAGIIARVPNSYIDKDSGERISLNIPPEKRVLPEWLLCTSDSMTCVDELENALSKSGKVNDALYSVIETQAESLGYALNLVTPENVKDESGIYPAELCYWELKQNGKVIAKYTIDQVMILKKEIAHYSNYLVSIFIKDGVEKHG